MQYLFDLAQAYFMLVTGLGLSLGLVIITIAVIFTALRMVLRLFSSASAAEDKRVSDYAKYSSDTNTQW